MSKKFVVVVSDVVQVSVEGKIADENGTPKTFKFILVCKRRSANELKAAFDATDFRAQDFIKDVATDWKGQRLVLEEDGQTPAPFCPDALDALLDISGMAMLCMSSYGKAASASAKN